jgi:arylsulfatase A-like enzyme
VLKTPNLDKLHAEAVRLTDFHSAPVCTPSRGQLLTGKDAMHNGAFAWAYSREVIHTDVKTMADIFRANGYMTAQFGKWHLGDNYPYRPIDRGFDESIKLGGASVWQTPDYWDNDNYDDHYEHNGTMEVFSGFCNDIWFQKTMEFAAQAVKKKKPFFIYLPTNLAHGPHIIDRTYGQKYMQALTDYKKKTGKDFVVGGTSEFFGMLDNFDENMGKLDAFLMANHLKDNTIVIYMSDNGGTGGVEVFNAGMRDEKGSNYDGGHRVPCFIRWPDGGLGKSRDIAELTEMQDILPTLVDLCGLECKELFDGISLKKLITGAVDQLPSRTLVVQHATAPVPTKYKCTVMRGKWRLVQGKSLYNIADDPHQDRNVVNENPELARELKSYYEKWWETCYPRVEKEPMIPLTQPNGHEVILVCFDWHEVEGKGNVTIQRSIRDGVNMSGYWNVEVTDAGNYAIQLARWPKESKVCLTAGAPDHKTRTMLYPAGKALPIRHAQLRIGDIVEQADVHDTDKAAGFSVHLEKGRYQLKGIFLDGNGKQLCGSYYAYVQKTASK